MEKLVIAKASNLYTPNVESLWSTVVRHGAVGLVEWDNRVSTWGDSDEVEEEEALGNSLWNIFSGHSMGNSSRD